MARFGQGISPQGNLDYTPFLQASLQGSQMAAQGMANIGQGLANLGQQIGGAVQQYYAKKEEKQQFEAATNTLQNLAQTNPQLAQSLGIQPGKDGKPDRDAIKAVVKGIGVPGALAAANYFQESQKQAAAAQQQAQDDAALQVGFVALQSGEDPMRAMNAAGVQPSPRVMSFFSDYQKTQADARKTAAEAARIEAGPSALEQREQLARVSKLEAEAAAAGQPKPVDPLEQQIKQAQLAKMQREEQQVQVSAADKAATMARRLEGEKERSVNILSQIDQAIDLASSDPRTLIPGTTGLSGKALSLVPGTPAYELKSMLDTIKANIGFDRLQQMREESPTGGALGQVAVEELRALQNSIAALEQGVSGKKLVENLKRVRTFYDKWNSAVDSDLSQAVQQAPVKVGRFTVTPKG